jgi:uncharacterized membrane protein
MDNRSGRALDARTVALTGLMIAVVAAFTLLIRIPIAATGGYVNLSDVAVFFTAFTLGPIPGLVAGGVGTGLADIIGGFPEFAWLSFIAHGLEGYLAGYIALRGVGGRSMFLGWLVGAAAMVTCYFLGEALILTGIGPALGELPFNVLQVIIGGVVGAALTIAVRQAYPPITQLNRPRTWREM